MDYWLLNATIVFREFDNLAKQVSKAVTGRQFVALLPLFAAKKFLDWFVVFLQQCCVFYHFPMRQDIKRQVGDYHFQRRNL